MQLCGEVWKKQRKLDAELSLIAEERKEEAAKLAKQAQSKEKTLAKMERAGLTEKVAKDRMLMMRFPDPGTIPPPVLQIQSVCFHYPGCEELYKDVDYGIDLDSRIALVGASAPLSLLSRRGHTAGERERKRAEHTM